MRRSDNTTATRTAVDSENPPWTKEDFARAVPFSALPERLQRALTERKRGEPKALKKVSVSTKLSVAILFLLFPFFASSLMAQRSASDPCPMRIEVAKNGDFYTNVMDGRYKTSTKTLEGELRGMGCYNDSHPVDHFTSVTVKVAPGAPTARTELLFKILEQNGWPKSKLKVQ